MTKPGNVHANVMATVTISWDSRRKDWLLEIRSVQQTKRWYYWLRADTTIELDEGTGWLILEQCKAAMEAQLF